jgi:hypothetical protein
MTLNKGDWDLHSRLPSILSLCLAMPLDFHNLCAVIQLAMRHDTVNDRLCHIVNFIFLRCAHSSR